MDSDIAILGEFQPKSAGKHFKSLNQPLLTLFPTSFLTSQSKAKLESRFWRD